MIMLELCQNVSIERISLAVASECFFTAPIVTYPTAYLSATFPVPFPLNSHYVILGPLGEM